MSESIFHVPKKLTFISTSKDKNIIDLATQEDSFSVNTDELRDPTHTATHIRSNLLDVSFTPQQKALLMTIFGISVLGESVREPSIPVFQEKVTLVP